MSVEEVSEEPRGRALAEVRLAADLDGVAFVFFPLELDLTFDVLLFAVFFAIFFPAPYS